MPTCKNCGEKWSWFYSLKMIFSFRKGAKCSHCGKIQFPSRASRNKIFMVTLIPIFVNFLLSVFIFPEIAHLSSMVKVLLEMIILLAVILTMPFFLDLNDKDEPLW